MDTLTASIVFEHQVIVRYLQHPQQVQSITNFKMPPRRMRVTEALASRKPSAYNFISRRLRPTQAIRRNIRGGTPTIPMANRAYHNHVFRRAYVNSGSNGNWMYVPGWKNAWMRLNSTTNRMEYFPVSFNQTLELYGFSDYDSVALGVDRITPGVNPSNATSERPPHPQSEDAMKLHVYFSYKRNYTRSRN